jgi:hypothetical protein
MNAFIDEGVIYKKGNYIEVNEKLHDDESKIIEMLEYINKFRSTN